ncbi:hypothetical protein NPIL_424641 [Nephila pilipes]|uniref:Uncharacterized protein n=1 Tax=Nephila pilipes TaxID=299642 RepID=A0A8X6MVC1_NEPPI|nr:hypothetical protein NPIL_424641 [Nephila pilipes]
MQFISLDRFGWIVGIFGYDEKTSLVLALTRHQVHTMAVSSFHNTQKPGFLRIGKSERHRMTGTRRALIELKVSRIQKIKMGKEKETHLTSVVKPSSLAKRFPLEDDKWIHLLCSQSEALMHHKMMDITMEN